VLILSRKVSQRILVQRDGKDLWLTVTKIGIDQNGQQYVKLGFEADSASDFGITRSELLQDDSQEVERIAQELVG
jgi:sRNA-binding carbon storage regulator CsrA